MMKKPPELKREKEEIAFWEKHSISDYWDELKESADVFKRPKLTPVTLKVRSSCATENKNAREKKGTLL